MFKTLRLAAPIVAALVLAGSALAQDTGLNGLWFKLKISAHGYAIRDDGSAPRKLAVSQTAYLHLSVNSVGDSADGPSLPSQSYQFDLWTQTGPNSWDLTYSDTESVESTNGSMYFVPDLYLDVISQNDIEVESYLTVMIRVKRDKSGDVRSATFTCLGAEVYGGSTPSGETVRGGLGATGKTVRDNSLPFLP